MLTATASDPDGTVASVAFYEGANLLNTDSTSPYTLQWTGVVAGAYSLTAVATDNEGNASTTATVNVTVNTAPPTIPNAPSALTAQVVSANRVDLGWTDNANNETGFKIERQEIVDGARTQVGPSSADPWPAENWDDAANISDFDSDSGQDLSGAVWNPISDTLWVCRNGPGSSGSKFWVIADDGTGDYDVQYKNGNRGEWTGLGDAEGITFVDYDEELVYIITEGEERIKSYDVSVYGVVSIVRNYDTSAYLPKSGGLGAEGITFVPDNWLVLAGFVDADGNPYTSQNGMGGLMFVGHQNGGRIYVFDLNVNADTFSFVGAFKTGFTETAGLEFDRSTGLLYIWHGTANDLEVTSLDSIVDGSERRLTQRGYFDLPGNANIEGLALPPGIDNLDWLFLTRDDGGADALRWFDQFDTGIQYDILGWSEIAQVDSDIQAYSDTSVVANTTYEYRVRAFNAQGDSDDSNVAQAQTPASRPAASGEPVLLAMRDGDVLSSGLGTRKFTTSQAHTGSPTPVYVVSSGGAEPFTNAWAVVDGDDESVWAGTAGAGGWWLALIYDELISVEDVEIRQNAETVSAVQILGSTDELQWTPLRDAWDLDQAAVLRFLWIVFPDDGSGPPQIEEVVVEESIFNKR
jgi:hypothetical protein